MNDNWTKVYATNLPGSAEVIKSVLEANDIQAVVLNRQDSSYHIGYCEVYVLLEDSEHAMKILNNDVQTE